VEARMALLIDLYEALKETAGEEKARRAIENLEAHIKEIKEEQATKDDIKLLIEQMNLRFEEVNRRFEEIDRRFEVVEKRLNFIQWFIALGFTLITVIMTLYRFFG
jgi:predicted RNase H-like nuclease (RuvC/YqgF family)